MKFCRKGEVLFVGRTSCPIANYVSDYINLGVIFIIKVYAIVIFSALTGLQFSMEIRRVETRQM